MTSIQTIVIPALQLTSARRFERSDRATTTIHMSVSNVAKASAGNAIVTSMIREMIVSIQPRK